jgi:hypothetical protein
MYRTHPSTCKTALINTRTAHHTRLHVLLFLLINIKSTLVQALRLCRGRAAHRGIEVQLYSFMTNGTRRE